MTIFQGRSGRKITGGRYRQRVTKKKHQLGRPAALTTVGSKGEVRKTLIRGLGGNTKSRLLRASEVNALDPSTGKSSLVHIDGVEQNDASKEFRRRNIITKGAILKTKKGSVRVTNRPGQEGFINGILIQE